MISLQKVGRVVPKVSNLALQTRSVVSGMPRGKLSKVEKIALQTVLVAGILATPTWVLCNLKYYNGTAQK